jgi:hypothetical protein
MKMSSEGGGKLIENADKMARLGAKLIEGGVNPTAVEGVLRAMGDGSTQSESVVDAVVETLPGSQQEAARRRGELDVIEKQPLVDAMVKRGIDERTAFLAVHGRTSIALSEGEPGRFTPGEERDMRQRVRALGNVEDILIRLSSQIDEDTVGVWSIISEKAGGPLQQFSLTRAIANSVGAPLGLDEETVRKAATARADFRLALLQMDNFMRENPGRLSNQQLQFLQEAQGLLSGTTTATTARQVNENMLALVRDLRQSEVDTLMGGGLPEASPQSEAPAVQGTTEETTTFAQSNGRAFREAGRRTCPNNGRAGSGFSRRR